MSRQAYINKDIPISEIRKVKRDLEKFVLLYEKITFIEDLYSDETVKDSIKKHGKTPQTGYKWLKSWNDEGFDGLFRKGNSGRISKLSDYQFTILKENIVSKGLSNVSDIKEEIQREFGVTYSERHLRRLIFDFGLLDIMNSNDDV
jgi:transposase